MAYNGPNDPGFSRKPTPAMVRSLRRANGGYRVHDPGFNGPGHGGAHGIAHQLAPRPTPELVSENGGVRHAQPRQMVGQAGVAPIFRSHPAAVVHNSGATLGPGNVALQNEENYAPINAGAVAAGTAAPVYQATPSAAQAGGGVVASGDEQSGVSPILQALIRQLGMFRQPAGGSGAVFRPAGGAVQGGGVSPILQALLRSGKLSL